MVAIILVTVSGEEEVLNMFRAISTQFEPKVLKPHIEDYAEDVRSEMVSRMHRDSGDMANSTHTRPVSGGRAVTVGVDYAEDENSRPGRKRGRRGTGHGTSHNFVEPSLKAVNDKKLDELIYRLDMFLRAV